MDDENSCLSLASNPEIPDFIPISPSVEKKYPNETSLDKFNTAYQPYATESYETDPHLKDFFPKEVEDEPDLEMLLDEAQDLPVCLPEAQDGVEDINIDEILKDENLIPNEACAVDENSPKSPVVQQIEEQTNTSTNKFEDLKEFLTFKTPRPVSRNYKKISSKNIEPANYLPSKSIHANKLLLNKNIKSTKTFPIIKAANKIPPKTIQINNRLVNKDKAKDIKINEFQNTQNSKLRNNVINDFVHISDRVAQPRAVAVLPSSLQIKHDIISTGRLLPPRVRFGPVQGIKRIINKTEVRAIVCDSAAMKTPVFFLGDNNGQTTFIDTSDKDKANWLCMLPIGQYETANVWLYEDNNELYGFTTKHIPAKTTLALGYSKAYADKYKIPTFQPILDLKEYAFAAKKWLCHACNRSFATETLKQRHFDFYHKNDKPEPWKRYSCKQCTNPSGRTKASKRHKEAHNEKSESKPVNISIELQPKILKENLRSITPIVEELLSIEEDFKNIEKIEAIENIEDIHNYKDTKKFKDVETFKDIKNFKDIQSFKDIKNFKDIQSFKDIENFKDIPDSKNIDNFKDIKNFEGIEKFKDIENSNYIETFKDVENLKDVENIEDIEDFEDLKNCNDMENGEGIENYDDTENFDDSENFEDTEDIEDPENFEIIEENLKDIDDLSNSVGFSPGFFENARVSDYEQSNSSFRTNSVLRNYEIREKDEDSLINDIEFMKFSDKLISNDVNDIEKSKFKVVSCVYYEQTVLLKKRFRHQYECNSRRIKCKCGSVFINKKRFIQHIYKEHKNDVDSKKSPKLEILSPEFKKYECKQCRIIFKRRGMLMNNLWRVHNTKTANVPLERRVKHYFCVACPKMYVTAAKRDRHVQLHHPGAEKMCAQCVQGSVVACPRQYATRAKLLQHVRVHHPHLAPPCKTETKSKLHVAS